MRLTSCVSFCAGNIQLCKRNAPYLELRVKGGERWEQSKPSVNPAYAATHSESRKLTQHVSVRVRLRLRDWNTRTLARGREREERLLLH